MTQKKRILFNGHDFKFLKPVIEHFKTHPEYEVSIDEHKGHMITDPKKSKALLEKADLIFCEWALGNAEWYSANKKSGQRLIIRLHRQEINLDYLHRINWNNVDIIIFIAPLLLSTFLERFSSIEKKTRLIYNPIECNTFDKPKLFGYEYNLGFIGISPGLKAPHLAFEILEGMKQTDKRYNLYYKGKQPWEYDWLWCHDSERDYYQKFFHTVKTSKHANSVVFDAHGNDIPDWLTKIGFLLSTSDLEGSHQAVAEAMAAGTIPIIRNWAGAALIYPPKYVFSSVEQAIDLVQKWQKPEHYLAETEFSKEYARANFDLSVILPQYEKLFDELFENNSSKKSQTNQQEIISLKPALNTPGRPKMLKAMHVCYINPGTQSGYVTRIIKETSILKKAGVHVILACFVENKFFSQIDQISAHLEFLRSQTGAHVHLISVDDYFNMSTMTQQGNSIVSTIIEMANFYRVDIIHGQTLTSAVYALRAREKTNARVVFDVHGVSPEESELYGAHPSRVKALAELEKELLGNVDLRIFVSERMRTYYERKYNTKSPAYTLLPCCVHSQKFTMSEDARQLKRKELNIEDRFVLLYLGTLTLWQWPEAMFSIYAQIYQQRKDSLFYLLLPESDHAAAHQFLEKYQISKESYRLNSLPHDQVGSVIGAADAGFLLREQSPINYVSSPTKFGEYMAAGVPVIATENIGDISEMIEKEKIGLILNLDAPTVSSTQLDRILNFVDEVQQNRNSWATRCQNIAENQWDWNVYGTILHNAYKKLASQQMSED